MTRRVTRALQTLASSFALLGLATLRPTDARAVTSATGLVTPV